MDDDYSVYQRTDQGRNEIRRKSHGLTQSERLVLILIDGVTQRSDVRSRLQGLTDERFSRVIDKLRKNNLIEEVLLQVANPVPESVDDSTADAFLRQDPLDPVTIISFEPEEEFGEHPGIHYQETFEESITTASATLRSHEQEQPSYPGASASLLDDGLPVSTLSAGIQPTTVGSAHPAVSRQQSSKQFLTAGTAELLLKKRNSTPQPSIARSTDHSTWRYWVLLLLLSILAAIAVLLV